MIVHEYNENYRAKINIKERQRKIEEMRMKKEVKIREAQEEKERKELESCTFAPKINRKKKQGERGVIGTRREAMEAIENT